MSGREYKRVAETNEQVQPTYWPQLDGLRLLAFLMVFASNLDPIPMPDSGTTVRTILAMVNNTLGWGWVGFDLFFVLSAFLITTLLLQEREKFGNVSYKNFLIRRALRIWPLYFMFLFLCLGFIPLLGAGISAILVNLKLSNAQWHILLDPYWIYAITFTLNFCLAMHSFPILISILWPICMAEQFYVGWGAVMSRVGNPEALIRSLRLLWLATIALRVTLYVQGGNYVEYYYNTLMHLDPIIAGALVAVLVYTQKIRPHEVKDRSLLFGLLPISAYLAISQFAPLISANQPAGLMYFTAAGVFGGMFLLGTLFTDWGKIAFDNPVATYIGRLTYGMYLFHIIGIHLARFVTQLIFSNINNSFLDLVGWIFYLLVAFGLTLLMAMGSWHLIEKRFYALRYKYTRIPSGFGAAA